MDVTYGPAQPPATCPRCRYFDQVRWVAGVVASRRDELSVALAAPMPPDWRPVTRGRGMPGWAWALLALIALSLPVDVILAVAVAVVAAVVGVVLGAVALVLGVGYAGYRYLNRHVIAERAERKREAAAAASRRYGHALWYWNQLAICHRCHGVFLPGNAWQHEEVTAPGAVVPPNQAWSLAQRLADYAERVHAPEVLQTGR